MRNWAIQALRILGQGLASAAAISALAGSITVSAQTTQTASPSAPSNLTDRDTFEVVSIRPADLRRLTGGSQAIVPCSGLLEPAAGRITITTATVFRLVAAAYGMPCGAASNLELISGGPDWARKEAFDIQATLPQGTPLYTYGQLQGGKAPKIQAMLGSLLADRFHLVLHRTPKDTPIFNVYFVKEGRVKLSADQTTPGQAPNPMASPLQVGNDPVAGIVRVRGDAIPIGVVINAGSVREGRLVVDKTGLTGLYDVQPSVIDVGPSVFQAGFSAWPLMMSYLGFKVESTRRPVDSIVIDRLERPTEN